MSEESKGGILDPTPVLSLDDKLGLVKRKLDKNSHIEVDQEGFRNDPERPIIYLCPAGVYEEHPETGEYIVNFENCLECGTCQVTSRDYVKWDNPQGGFGVTYQYG